MSARKSETAGDLEKRWVAWSGDAAEFRTELSRLNIEYLSWSRMSTFLRCRACYFRDYVLRQRTDSDAMLYGHLFHELAHDLYAPHRSDRGEEVFGSAAFAQLPEGRQHELRSAHALLLRERWSPESVLAVEEPFFLELSQHLPPVYGIPDLVVREDSNVLLVVDHKTTTVFQERELGQLLIYGEMVRGRYGVEEVAGCFDEYRRVADLARIRKPAFRRTRHALPRTRLPSLVAQWEEAWPAMRRLHSAGNSPASADGCWYCVHAGRSAHTGLANTAPRPGVLQRCGYDESEASVLALQLDQDATVALIDRGLHMVADVARAANESGSRVRMLSRERAKMWRVIEKRRLHGFNEDALRVTIPEHLRSRTVKSLGLAPRITQALHAYGCTELRHLNGLHELEILGIRAIGGVALEEIIRSLDDLVSSEC